VRRNKRISDARCNPPANGSVVIAINSRNRALIKPALQQAFEPHQRPALE
jgi:hypothetical protein